MGNLDLFEELSEREAILQGMAARLPTASWITEYLNCEGVATLPWEQPDSRLQELFNFGTAVHEATATRYVGLVPVLEAGSRVDIESRAGVALIPELTPISEAGAVEVPFELTPDGSIAHVVDAEGKIPRSAQHRGIFGRADYAGRDVDDQLRVLDLKTGNPDYLQMPLVAWQLRAYAVMLWEVAEKKDDAVLLSFAAVRGACRLHSQLAWEEACPGCRRARPTSRATTPLLESWALQLRKALTRARELQDGASPVFRPNPKHCGRCRARASCPAYASANPQKLPMQPVDTTAA